MARRVPIWRDTHCVLGAATKPELWDDFGEAQRNLDEQKEGMQENMRFVFDEFCKMGRGLPQTNGTSLKTFLETSRLHDAIVTLPDGSQKLKFVFDVRHYDLEELTVTINDRNLLVVDAKHLEHKDGIVQREYHRQHSLPSNSAVANLSGVLSGDGVLTVEVPLAVPLVNGDI